MFYSFSLTPERGGGEEGRRGDVGNQTVFPINDSAASFH